jgi:hypothetical protein
MIPTIEASLMIQDGSCTLADVIYAIGHLYQVEYRVEESAVLLHWRTGFGYMKFHCSSWRCGLTRGI